MIPKRIHYCWFGGGAKDLTIVNCIASWKKFCPDYEIIEWNENNTDCSLPFVQYAIRQKKWAFVADVIRLDVLINQGGIYLDTDMLLVKSLDEYLNSKLFIGVEAPHMINGAIIGSVCDNRYIKKVRRYYDQINFGVDFNFHNSTIPIILSETFKNMFGKDLNILEPTTIDNVTMYPSRVFYPLPNSHKMDIKNYKNYLSEDTAAVHLWNASWVDYNEFDYIKQRKYFQAVNKIITRLLSRDFNSYYFVRLYKNFRKSL